MKDSQPPARQRGRGVPPGRGKRQPGRPSRGDDATDRAYQRERLLDAAIACYVRKGIAASSQREIACEANVKPALVNYYFGGKDELRDAVVTERILPAVAELRAPMAEAGDDVLALASGFVSKAGQMAVSNPWFPALWVREVLCEGGALREVLFERIGPDVPAAMVRRFANARTRGELNAGLDPRLMMVSLVGLTFFPIAGAAIWRRLFADAGFDTGDFDMDALHRHTLALLEHGLRQG